MDEQEKTGVAEESRIPEKKYYHDVNLEEAEASIRASLRDAARSVIAVGHYLKVIRDKELYLEGGYGSIWDYASERFGFSKSTASRYMARNDKFSVGGNSPVLAEQYRDYSKAQLQEMLSLDAEQMSAVTPDMTVREIRELRRPKEIPYFEIPGQLSLSDFPEIDVEQESDENVTQETKRTELSDTASFTVTAEELIGDPEEELSAYGLPKTVYPPDSLISCPGCKGESGRGYSCFNCHMECGIRQEYCYCVEAAMGNPFPCAMVGSGMVETLRQEIGESCQFVNLDLAERKVGTDEPVPCCQQCANPCVYACQISKKRVATSQQKEPTALPNGGEAAAEKQQEECTSVESEKTHDAQEEPEKHELIEYDQEILDGMIREVRQKLYIMKEYWIKSQPQYYTKHRMMLRAYELLMKAGS